MTEDRLLVMPKLGLTMTDGVVAKWEKAPGDRFADGDVIVIIETDKTTHEVVAPAAGVLGPVKASEGQTVEVGKVLADWVLDTAASSVDSAGAPEPVRSPAQAPVSRLHSPRAASVPARSIAESGVPAVAAGRLLATPYARRIGRERGVDLRSVQGSGPRGRVHARDVEALAIPIRAHPSPAPASYSSYCSITVDIDVTRVVDAWRSFARGDAEPDIPIAQVLTVGALRALRQMHDGPASDRPARSAVRVVRDIEHAMVACALDAADDISFASVRARLDSAATAADDRLEQPVFVTIRDASHGGVRYLTSHPTASELGCLAFGSLQEVFRPDHLGAPVLHKEVGLVLTIDERSMDRRTAFAFLAQLQAMLARPLSLMLS